MESCGFNVNTYELSCTFIENSMLLSEKKVLRRIMTYAGKEGALLLNIVSSLIRFCNLNLFMQPLYKTVILLFIVKPRYLVTVLLRRGIICRNFKRWKGIKFDSHNACQKSGNAFISFQGLIQRFHPPFDKVGLL